MTTASTGKMCRICNKDVSNTKRVKDAQGQYYCEPCYQTAMQRQAAAGGSAIGTTPAAKTGAVASAAGAKPAVPSPVGVVKPAQPAKPTMPKPIAAPTVAAAEPAKSGPKPLPKFCPNCNAPVLPNRKLCIKCNRDVTQMDRLIAMKAEAEKGPNKEEVFATWVGRVVKVALIIVCVGIGVFVLWGIYLQFAPNEPFSEYPTSREALIKEWLADIGKGTDKGYSNAYLLVSFRERVAGNDRSENSYKALFGRINDDMTKRYGADWASKVTVTNPDPASVDETTSFDVAIDKDHYTTDVQVQISLEQGAFNLTLRRDRPKYPENGKWHFGMVGLEAYPIHIGSGMEDIVGKPDRQRRDNGGILPPPEAAPDAGQQ